MRIIMVISLRYDIIHIYDDTIHIYKYTVYDTYMRIIMGLYTI